MPNLVFSQAALGGHSKCVHLLLSKGADINARDFNMRTPLHEAATEDRSGITL